MYFLKIFLSIVMFLEPKGQITQFYYDSTFDNNHDDVSKGFGASAFDSWAVVWKYRE